MADNKMSSGNNYMDKLQQISGVSIYEGQALYREGLNAEGREEENWDYTQKAKQGDFIVMHPDSKQVTKIGGHSGLIVQPAKYVNGACKIIGELFTNPDTNNNVYWNLNNEIPQEPIDYPNYTPRVATVKFYGRVREYNLAAEHPAINPYDFLTVKPGTNDLTKANAETKWMSLVGVPENRGNGRVTVLCNPEIINVSG